MRPSAEKSRPEPTAAAGPDAELLVRASVLLAEAALEVRRAGAGLTAGVTGWRFALDALREPVPAAVAAASVARALFNPAGLGFGPVGGPVGEAMRWAGAVTRRRSAAVGMAADAFDLRVRAAAAGHPNLESPMVARLVEAVAAGERLETARAWCALVERLGVTRALTTIGPVAQELLAWAGLFDENPFNDDAAWAILHGELPPTDPVLGLPSGWISYLERGPGNAEAVDPDPLLARTMAHSANDITSYLDNMAALGNHGAALLRRIHCTDGETRYVLLLPGLSFAKLSNNTPADLAGGIDNTVNTDTTYTRAARRALESAGVPVGAELMIIGHSLGGMAAMNLAADLEFVTTYRLTHVIPTGSAIDDKRPADPDTKVISLVNGYDLITGMDGRGPAAPHDLPPGWTELAWLDATFDYPLSHSPQAYAISLRGLAAPQRDTANELLSRYDGEIVGNQLYLLRDR
ncbi:hypothetical protein F4556_007170 [Kitasatospora gansuensis]|uniref:Fungal lipase-like domain-containing protein n=1 Tax=Kitasatospora gansuensis TaxID=258050 RepID=A0A7W7SJM4_9ACTN|nr:hypothetical protein [Kitasatospora gansuensis]MBB4951635.1 hypothetical protein [Kitasatospora gansuensis]